MKDNGTTDSMQELPNKNQAKEVTGLVIAHFGQRITIEVPDGLHISCHLRRNQALPVVGDNVVCQVDEQGQGVVLEILPRRSVLQRGNKFGQEKPLAANIDLLLIVMNPPPILSTLLVDRYTIAAELLGITPVLVLNKIDSLDKAEQARLQQALTHYTALGCEVIFTSCVLPNGLAALLQVLSGKRAVLVGPSGVGKSSIIKALTTHSDIQIGEVSQKGIGKHTTTATRLYHLTGGGELIDSPGVRDFQLWSLNKTELLQGFKEMKGYATCRFRDCVHVTEPDCGVRFALQQGKISPARYEHYCAWLKEIKR